MVIWKGMLKIRENLLNSWLPQAQFKSKFKNFCAQQEQEANDEMTMLSTENVKKSHLGPKLLAF